MAYEDDLINLQRQQMLAQMLQQQGSQGMQPQMVNGRYVAPSPFANILGALQQVGGTGLAAKNMQSQIDLTKQRRMQIVQALQSMAGAPGNQSAMPAMPAVSDTGASTPSSSGDPLGVNAPSNSTPTGAPAFPVPRNQKIAAALSVIGGMPIEQQEKLLGEIAKQHGFPDPTPDMKEIAAVYGEGSPEYNAALERKVNPPIATQPNAPLARFNPTTKQFETAYAAPNLEKGINPIIQNGQIVGEQPLPGAAQVEAAMAAARKAGEISQTPTFQPNATGQPTPVFVTPPMLRNASPSLTAPQPTQAGAGLQTTAGKSSQEALGKNAADYATALSDRAAAAVEGKRTLSEMTGLLQGFTPGKFAPVLEKIGSAAQALGVSPQAVQSLTDMNPGDAQAFQKGTAALATEAAKQVSNRVTQMEFKVFLQNNPNWMMTPDGIKRVMDFMDKGFDQPIAQQQEFAGWRKQHPAETWTTDFPAYWNKKQMEKINHGDLRSTPSQFSTVETSTDIANSGVPTRINSKDDYEKLKSGTTFVGPDGISYRKP